MLKLTSELILLNQLATNKTQAIELVAGNLSQQDFVESEYLKGMLAREQQTSTYLGNGIAIPHGTTDTRNLVKKTGILLHQFPQGVDWGEGNIVYAAIGIAAKSDEHLEILKQLTKILSDDGIEEKLKQAKTKQDILAIFTPPEAPICSSSLIQIDFPAANMMQMLAVGAGLLSNYKSINSSAIAQIISQQPTYLGEGIWSVGCQQGVNHSAVSFIRSAQPLTYQQQPLKALLTFASNNNQHRVILEQLIKLISQHEQAKLLNSDTEQLLALLLNKPLEKRVQSNVTSSDSVEGIFIIHNEHGLHARPCTELVKVVKKFKADIKVMNLTDNSKLVSAKSLMKIISLGVMKGHQLKFIAMGEDAQSAIDAIGSAIENGLGE